MSFKIQLLAKMQVFQTSSISNVKPLKKLEEGLIGDIFY